MGKVLLNCIPNISEGRDESTIAAVAEAARSVGGVKLMSVAPDPDHNRCVYSFIGGEDGVLEAAKRVAVAALERIDMTKHRGVHPRIGALDVVPFVALGEEPEQPLRGASERGTPRNEAPLSDSSYSGASERDSSKREQPLRESIPAENRAVLSATRACRAFGAWLGARGIPVYYYGTAATRGEREELPNVRRGEYEGLAAKLADPLWLPDEGPAEFNALSGATAVGVRDPLIAFNVNLMTADVSVAKRIAKAVRYSSGGYRGVRALGVELPTLGMTQVSMNLIDYRRTPIPRVLETVRGEAARYGVNVAGTEIIGAVPADALDEIVRHYLQCGEFSRGQVYEKYT